MQKGFLRKLLQPLVTGQNRFTTLCVLIICVMYGLVVFYNKANEAAASWQGNAATAGSTVVSVGQPQIGGPFRLQRALPDGSTAVFTEADLEGKISLIFFGFTHCPDICPAELSKYVQISEQLGDLRAKVQFIFISVDPVRDTPQQLADYVGSFDESFVALTGTPEQIKRATDAYLVYAVVQEPAEGAAADDYMVDHSGYTYVMDATGTYIRHYTTHTPVAEMVAGVKAILK